MPEYAQIDLFVYKAKIFRNRFVTIGWFNQINYMRGRRQDRILFLIGSSPAGGLFLFLPAVIISGSGPNRFTVEPHLSALRHR